MTSLSQIKPAGSVSPSQAFIEAVESREASVAILGLGYVGLPLVLGFHGKGFPVLGVDIDQSKIDSMKRGESYIKHIPSSRFADLANGRFEATTDFAALANADAILICVPTPLTKHLEPDMSYVVSTSKAIAPHLKPGHLVVLESTTYPGTTRDLMQPILEEGSGLKANEDFFVAYSPEREDPGNPDFDTQKIPKVIGASTQEALDMTDALYKTLIPKVVPVSSPETAEAVKLTENIFRAVNIAMVNELKLIYAEMGIDIWEVIDAAKTKPFGFMPFYPGPGLGGHCIPIDPFYLTWKAREFGLPTRFIELAGQINRRMPSHVVGELQDALSDHQQKALRGARVLVSGVAYKKNVDDMRESPSLTLIELLEAAGAIVEFYDPFIPELPPTREHAHLTGRKSVSLDGECLARFDAVLIATDHDDVDYKFLVENSKLVVDTRNACAKANVSSEKVVKA
ncbi:MAG: nucleotide sugar dehydrogenase [Hyphomicrobiaceae bacterium]